jgi:hypothetical protein
VNFPCLQAKEKVAETRQSLLVTEKHQTQPQSIALDRVGADMGTDLAAMKAHDLRDACLARGLSSDGSTSELVKRLNDDISRGRAYLLLHKHEHSSATEDSDMTSVRDSRPLKDTTSIEPLPEVPRVAENGTVDGVTIVQDRAKARQVVKRLMNAPKDLFHAVDSEVAVSIV